MSIELDMSPDNILIPAGFKYELHDQKNIVLIGFDKRFIKKNFYNFNFDIYGQPKNQKPETNFRIMGHSSEVKEKEYGLIHA